jgi:hypothetical protein
MNPRISFSLESLVSLHAVVSLCDRRPPDTPGPTARFAIQCICICGDAWRAKIRRERSCQILVDDGQLDEECECECRICKKGTVVLVAVYGLRD